MDPKLQAFDKRIRLSWAFVLSGVVMFVVGEVLRANLPASALNFKVISAIGILAIGIGAGNVVRGLLVRGNPEAARRLVNAENDERSKANASHAGNAAFLVSFLLNSLVLIVYSSMSAGRPGFDLLWWVLAGMVLVPSIFYVSMLVWLERH